MSRPDPRPWTWPALLLNVAARVLLAAVVSMAAWGALPAVIGWHPTTVSSGSMMPRLRLGDVAVSRPLGHHVPPISSVLLFDDPDHPGRLRMHRFVRLDDDGRLVTRGDANPDDDSSPVDLAAVRGIGTLRVPWVGLPVVWVREGRWLPLGLTAGAFALLLLVTARGRDRGFDHDPPDDDPADDDEPPDDPGPVTRARPRRPWQRRHQVLASVVVVVLGATSAVPADAVLTDTTETRASLAANPWFRCSNAMTALGPALWYRLDETSSTTTTATDSSTNNLTGVYGSGGKTSVTVKACTRDTGRAMTFNGSSGYLSSPQLNVALPNTFTLAVWFRTTTRAGGKLVGFGNVQTGASGVYDRHLYMSNAGKVYFGVYPGSVKTVSSASGLNDGTWHLAVATLSSAGMRLYVDGGLVASDPSTTTGEPASSGYLRVAYDNLDNWVDVPSSRYFSGTLDDVAAFTSALTPGQVNDLYEAGTT